MLVGVIELVVLENRLTQFSLGKKVLYKFLIYTILMCFIIVVAFMLATSIELGTNPFDSQVVEKTTRFMGSIVLLNTIVQLCFQLMLSLLYAAISENLGYQVLFNFFTGKYHKPKKERRIFMFLDMKSSTSIAESLGNEKYFQLLQAYYDSMSDAIINTHGEVYQYIGDEVVITWMEERGVENSNCLLCFQKIRESISAKRLDFKTKFGLIPEFKAAIHLGEVTTGEIGALKKEVIYTGDVLNTTARVQGLCNQYKTDLIFTEDLLHALPNRKAISYHFLGELSLKGKTQKVKLYDAMADQYSV